MDLNNIMNIFSLQNEFKQVGRVSHVCFVGIMCTTPFSHVLLCVWKGEILWVCKPGSLPQISFHDLGRLGKLNWWGSLALPHAVGLGLFFHKVFARPRPKTLNWMAKKIAIFTLC